VDVRGRIDGQIPRVLEYQRGADLLRLLRRCGQEYEVDVLATGGFGGDGLVGTVLQALSA